MLDFNRGWFGKKKFVISGVLGVWNRVDDRNSEIQPETYEISKKIGNRTTHLKNSLQLGCKILVKRGIDPWDIANSLERMGERLPEVCHGKCLASQASYICVRNLKVHVYILYFYTR